MQQQIQSCGSAAIPDITTSVITALTAHGLIMAPTSLQSATTTTAINHTPGQYGPVTQTPLMNTNTVYPPVRQHPISTNTSIYTQIPPSIVPSTNTLTQLSNQFTDHGYVIQSNTTMSNALVQPVTNTCISTSNQQQNAVPTTSMTNETIFAFLNTIGTCSSSMLVFSKPNIAKPLALGVDPKAKAKIWAHEYVDLGTLLNSKFPRARFTVVKPYEGGMAWEKLNLLLFVLILWHTGFLPFISL